MSARAIARPYAAAVFAVAKQQDDIDAWGDALRRMAAVAEALATARAGGAPLLTEAQMAGLVAEMAADALNPARRRFIDVLADNGRVLMLPFIAREFDALHREHAGVVPVRVETAMPVEDREAMNAALARWLGKKVEVEYCDNPALLGGLCVYAHDNVLDASLRGRLNRLATTLN